MHYRRLSRNGDPRKLILSGNGFVKEGYKMIPQNGHSIKLCRYIMQKHLGRAILTSEIVHHINSDKLDDKIENLQIVSRSEHAHIHHNIRKHLIDAPTCLHP